MRVTKSSHGLAVAVLVVLAVSAGTSVELLAQIPEGFEMVRLTGYYSAI